MDPITIPAAALEHAIRQHGGNRTAIAAALNVSMNTIRRLIRQAGMVVLADTLAAEARRPGPRKAVPAKVVAAEKKALRMAVDHMGVRGAAEHFDIPISTMYRRLRD